MAKKNYEHGPLYSRAEKELDLAGLVGGKGKYDQVVRGTVLRLIDLYERGAATELVGNTIQNIFSVLINDDLLQAPSNDPAEWRATDGLGEGSSVNVRSGKYFSRDGGSTWFRPDTGAMGESIKVTEEVSDGSEESKEDVQSSKS